MTPVTFPHPPTLCWWKTLCHAMTSNNFPMKEWFLPTSCCSEGGTGVTVGTAWLGRGSSCIALLSIWILWTFPQADAISGNHPVGRCLISPGDFPEHTFSTVEKLPVTNLPSSASVEQITRQEWIAELITSLGCHKSPEVKGYFSCPDLGASCMDTVAARAWLNR